MSVGFGATVVLCRQKPCAELIPRSNVYKNAKLGKCVAWECKGLSCHRRKRRRSRRRRKRRRREKSFRKLVRLLDLTWTTYEFIIEDLELNTKL
jgi:hypothetical protein